MSEQGDGGRPLLEVEGLECSYGPLQVLFGVSLAVPDEGRVALLGTNGAGKSTLLRAIAGLIEPDAGTIRFDGQDLAGLSPAARVGLGMTLVEGGRATFPSLSIEENLRLGAYPFLRDRPRVDGLIGEILDLFPQLRARLRDPAGVCSGGEQQMMAIGRALVAKPRLLMIDELSLGLAPIVMAEILGAIEQVVDRGSAILLVEQSLNIALSLAARAYFMEKGEVRFSGPTSDLVDRGDLVRSVFFGADTAVAEEVVSR